MQETGELSFQGLSRKDGALYFFILLIIFRYVLVEDIITVLAVIPFLG
jgi:hypothetical protein